MRHFNICLAVVFSVFVLTLQSAAQNKVVVIPLIGAEPTGDVQPEDVLEGITFSSSSGTGLIGTMPNIGKQDITPGTVDQTISEGYHDGWGQVAGDADLVSQNIKSGVSIFGVSGDSNVVDTSSGDAAAGDIRAGKKAWVGGAEVSGNLSEGSNVTGVEGHLSVYIPDGIYELKKATAQDGDLISANVKSGVNIFGVSGDSNVVNTSSGDAGAGDIMAGKKAWVDGSEVAGTLSAGGSVCAGTMNGTRWCDQGDGTVLDMTTGLVWLRKADWGGRKPWRNPSTDCSPPKYTCYDDAHSRAGILKHGTTGADLSDGSTEGDWRLPTKNELWGLASGTEAVRSSAPRAFTGVQSWNYWSGTTSVDFPTIAWLVYLVNGNAYHNFKEGGGVYVWPVRGGQ